MNISTAGIELIKKLEGCILHAYKDVAGVPTIGVGHTGGVYMGQTITQAEADELLRNDLQKFVDRVNKFVKVSINQNQFDALVAFDFNTGGLATSTLLKKLNAGDYQGASAEFDKWVKITDPETGKKVTSNGLVNRRNAEQALFNTPVKASPVVAKPKSGLAPYSGQILKKGIMDNPYVKLVQGRLGIHPDGDFGNATYLTVRNYQAHHNLTIDGIIGPKTWNKIFPK